MENGQKTQLQTANEALQSMAPSITTSDRDAAKQLYSHFTIVQYLAGRGKNLDTAISLLQFFKPRIEGRDKILAEMQN